MLHHCGDIMPLFLVLNTAGEAKGGLLEQKWGGLPDSILILTQSQTLLKQGFSGQGEQNILEQN